MDRLALGAYDNRMTKERAQTRSGQPWLLVLRRTLVIAIAAALLFALVRFGLIEAFTAWNRAQFASRPELENWALPGYGVETPATMWAAGAALFFCAIAAFSTLRTRAGLPD